mgnify:CR=1 FL=1
MDLFEIKSESSIKMETTRIKAPESSIRVLIDLNTEIQIEILSVIKKFKSSLIGIKVNEFLKEKREKIKECG